jgi:hypothetical protein
MIRQLKKTTKHRSCGCTDAHVLNYGDMITIWCKRHNSSISNSPEGWAAHAPDEVYEMRREIGAMKGLS